jgi:hypothetical protein
LSNCSINPAKLHGLPIRQLVQGFLCDIEPAVSVIDRQHVDAFSRAGVRQLPARSALGGIPSCDRCGTADVREVGNVAEGVKSIAGDEAVGTVRAGDGGQRSVRVIVRVIVGYGDGESWNSERDRGEDERVLHLRGCCEDDLWLRCE